MMLWENYTDNKSFFFPIVSEIPIAISIKVLLLNLQAYKVINRSNELRLWWSGLENIVHPQYPCIVVIDD